MSKERATATLRESLASRLQMYGGPSNGSRISATPVTVREAAESAQSTPLGTINRTIKKRVQRNSTVSMRKVTRETGISCESVRLITKQELQLNPYKLQMVQLLTADSKRVGLDRCRRRLRRVAPLNYERILFTDEKLFAIEQAHNHQNDRSWCAEAPGTSVIVEHRLNPKPVMVWT